MFDIKCEREEFDKLVSKESLIELVKNRSWSNLYKNTNEEIHDSIEILKALPEHVPAKLCVNVFYLRKAK